MTYAYGRPHRRERAEAIAALEPGTPCPCGCGSPMFRSPAQAEAYGASRWLGELDFDHVAPLALGGDPNGERRICHSRCNRRAGQLVGARRRASGLPRRTVPARRKPKPKYDRW